MKFNSTRPLKLFIATLLASALASQAATFKCEMTAQSYLASEGATLTASSEEMRKRQASVIIEDEKTPFVERCSFAASANKVTCDRYQIDRVEIDRNVNIKKFYVFRSQFDVQLFSNLTAVENNGRGGVAFGACKIVKP